jgi:NAD(P)-dependent dehydrogenase (short-subunit alcohol dehydrogenase family)
VIDVFRLDGKVAVIIGGSGAIGEAIAGGMAQYGAKVVVASRRLPELEKIAQAIQAEYAAEVAAFSVDVTDEKSVARLVEQVVKKFGTVDILVNSQGINIKKPATSFPVDEWDMMYQVNVRSIMLTCREFGKVMIEKKQGKIINLSSLRGARATQWGGNEAYCSTKGAVDMITRALASEWASYQINVNAIAPAWVNTKFSESLLNPERYRLAIQNIPLARIGQLQDVVGVSIFLASPASDFITGQIIYVDGGATAVI